MHRILSHRRLVIGATVLAFAGAGGGAYAATQSSSANPQQAYLNDVARRLHVSPQKLTAAIKAATVDRLKAAVKAGELTQAQANALEKRVQQNGAPLLGLPPFLGLPFLGRGFVPGRLGPPPFFGPAPLLGGPPGSGPLGSAAKYLGLSESQLFGQLRPGHSLAQIAKARGKSVSGLEKAMIAAVKSKLDKAVSARAMSKSQEQKILSMASSGIKALVNGKLRQFSIARMGPPGAWSRGMKPPGGAWSKPPGSSYAPLAVPQVPGI